MALNGLILVPFTYVYTIILFIIQSNLIIIYHDFFYFILFDLIIIFIYFIKCFIKSLIRVMLYYKLSVDEYNLLIKFSAFYTTSKYSE